MLKLMLIFSKILVGTWTTLAKERCNTEYSVLVPSLDIFQTVQHLFLFRFSSAFKMLKMPFLIVLELIECNKLKLSTCLITEVETF